MQTEPTFVETAIDVCGLTHVGRVREENQDHFLVCTLRKQIEVHSTNIPDPESLPLRGERLATLALVADGVGGETAGAEASRMALEGVVQHVSRSLRCFHFAGPGREEEFHTHLRDSVSECQAAVLARAEESSQEGMATTLTIMMAVWPRAYVVQVGDSRCYWLRKGELTQITRDQTLAQELVEQGEITPQEAAKTRLGNVLVSAIGAPKAVPVITAVDLRRRDVILLCSDGLTSEVPDELIRRRLLEMESSEQACRTLVDDALAAGGRDNVTVLVGRVLPS